MSNLKQDDRPISVETPLGKDRLVLTSFTGEERLSGLFSFTLQMQSEDGGIKAKDIVGQAVDFQVRHQDGEERWFNGIVNGFAYAGKGDRAHIYKAHVVPWFWFLTRGSDCRVHECDEKKDAKQIIDALLSDLGFSDFQWKVQRSLAKRPYCVQYRETHFDFICRLLGEEGIFYYFTHEKGKHTLVFADHTDGVYDVKDADATLLANLSITESGDNLTGWDHEFAYTSGKWTVNDYDFENPASSLLADASSLVSLKDNSKLEFYDFPGDYLQKGVGSEIAKLRMEAEEATHESVAGSSSCRSFSPGGRFQITKHQISDEEGQQWVLTEVQHQVTLGGNYVSGAAHSDVIYQNTFRCLPAGVVFRPPRERGKPRVMGMQSARVVGPAGEEIHTDKYGRIRVQFPWDREGNQDEKSSLWIRVSTPWAGQQWGMIHIPRIGQEVLVSFLEGDPDRPVVTGMLYNADNMPPYSLPDNQTQSGIKTRSSKNGSSDNFNEIRFEDKKGEEEVYIHAEKDLNCVVENNETRKIGFETKDAGDQIIDIYNDRSVTLEKGNDSLLLKQGNMSVELKMGNQDTTLKMGNQDTTLKMGNQKTKLDLGKSETEAMQSIELKVGQSSIKVDQAGVTIKGLMIKVEGTAMTQIKGLMTQVNGDAMLTVKGGLTMIN